MKQAFIGWTPRAETMRIVALAVAICEEYDRMGYGLTLRQLFYLEEE